MPRAKRTADYLLVDISNSFTKLAFASTERIGRASRVPTRKLSHAAMQKVLQRRDVGAVVVSSVVPAKDAVVRRAARRTRVLFIDANAKLGVGVDYPHPK